MTTTILHDGAVSGNVVEGNIYLVGRGNALLSERDLEQAVESIARMGVKKITGDIIADDTAFDARGLERTRKGTGYAPPAALGARSLCEAFQITAPARGDRDGAPASPFPPETPVAVAAPGSLRSPL